MIKVLVKWQAKPGKEKTVEGMLSDLRSKAILRPGYITGETLAGVTEPTTYMVVSTWTRLETWQAWEESQERHMIIQLIAPNTTGEPLVWVYKHLFEDD